MHSRLVTTTSTAVLGVSRTFCHQDPSPRRLSHKTNRSPLFHARFRSNVLPVEVISRLNPSGARQPARLHCQRCKASRPLSDDRLPTHKSIVPPLGEHCTSYLLWSVHSLLLHLLRLAHCLPQGGAEYPLTMRQANSQSIVIIASNMLTTI